MMNKVGRYLAGVLWCFLLFQFQIMAWRVEINGSASLHDSARTVTVDSQGHVIAGGYLWNMSSGRNLAVTKLNGATGEAIWRREISGSAQGQSDTTTVIVDAEDHVIASGYVENIDRDLDFVVVKLHGVTGEVLWYKEIDGTSHSSNVASDVKLDAQGDVVAVGVIDNQIIGRNFAVVKLSGTTGEEIWRAELGDSRLGAHAVAVDSEGDIIAAGDIYHFGTFSDFAVIKLKGETGRVIWRKEINGSANADDLARAVVLDTDGNAIAAGYVSNVGKSHDFAVTKLHGGTGELLWYREINGSANSYDEAQALALDEQGDILAAGFVTNLGTSIDFVVLKLQGGTGQSIWFRQINGSGNEVDDAFSVTVDAQGDAIAVGRLWNIGTGWDFAVLKFDGTTGDLVWYFEVDGSAHSVDIAFAVAVDAQGDVFAAGYLWNVAVLTDFTVLKLQGTDGSDFVP